MTIDAKQLEAWLRLSADAVRGGEQARQAMRSLGQAPISPEAVGAWMRLWMPQASAGASGGASGEATTPAPTSVQEFQDMVEQWWAGLGVVPRYRYLEVVRRCEELKVRLEEAEETVKHLRELLAEGGHEQEAAGMLDSWESMTQKALEAQAEWARMWTEGPGGGRAR